MDNKKIPTGIGIVIIMIITITVGFLVWKYQIIKKQEKTQNQNITIQPKTVEKNANQEQEQQFEEIDPQELKRLNNLTKNWKTFRDEKYGYEFKYPQDYVIEKNKYTKDIDEVSVVSNGKCIQDFDSRCDITIRALSSEDERVKDLEQSYNALTSRFLINENRITYRLSDGLSAIMQTKQKNYFLISRPYPKEIITVFQGIYSTFKEIHKEKTLKKVKEDGVYTYYEGEAIISGKYQEIQPGRLFGGKLCFFVNDKTEYLIPRKSADKRVPWFCFSNQDEAKKMFGIDDNKAFENLTIANHKIEGGAKIEISNYIVDKSETETSDTAKLEKIISKEKYSLEEIE